MFKPGSQNDKLLTHLISGNSITRYEALLMFRVQNMTARISDLRAHGYDVQGTTKVDPNGQRYERYSL